MEEILFNWHFGNGEQKDTFMIASSILANHDAVNVNTDEILLKIINPGQIFDGIKRIIKEHYRQLI